MSRLLAALRDPVRRDILIRLKSRTLTVAEVAAPYIVSLAAVSRQLAILERSELIVRRRQGRTHLISLPEPAALAGRLT